MSQILQATDNIISQVETIVSDDNNVIEVHTPHGLRYFVYSSLEQAYRGSSTSVSYNSFKGIEITSFVFTVRDVLHKKPYLQALMKFLESKEFINIKFAEVIPYFTFTK